MHGCRAVVGIVITLAQIVFMEQINIRIILFHLLRVPVDGLSAVVYPKPDEPLVTAMACIFAEFSHEFVLVNYSSRCFLLLCSDRSNPMSLVHAADGLFNHDYLGTCRSSSGSSHESGIACPNNKDLCIQCFNDFCFSNFRSGSQPVETVYCIDSRSILDGDSAAFYDRPAACLKDTIRHSILNCYTCIRCTGYTVNRTALGLFNLFGQCICSHAADSRCFSTRINSNIENMGFVKGYCHDHITFTSPRTCSISTWSIYCPILAVFRKSRNPCHCGKCAHCAKSESASDKVSAIQLFHFYDPFIAILIVSC